MPQRRTLCSRPRRGPMDKSIADKSRNRLWFVIFMSFVCWFLILLYFHRTYSREFSFSILGNYVDNAEQLSVVEKERVGNGIANVNEVDNVDQLERENGMDSEASIVARKGAKQNESDAMPIVKIGNESATIQDDAGESKQDVEKEKNGNGDSDIVEAANMKDIFAFVETMQPENRTKIEKQHISEVVVKKKRGRKRRSNNAKNKAVAAEKKDDGSWKMVVESQQKPREASPSPPPPLPPPPPPKPGDDTVWLKVVFSTPQRDVDCSGRYIYIHDIPSRFNGDLLKNCDKIARWTDMCEFLSHMGLGPRLPNPQKIFSNTGWYATNQFSLEVIFHNRMKQYECLTKNSSLASAIYVPFYAGLDVSQYLWCCNNTARDSAPHSLVKWLRDQPEWNVMGGRDHFMVEGRICWDFRRPTDKKSDWGSILLHLPEVKNMTNLVIESSPWNSSDHAIPYPTYFHPSTDGEVLQWQDRMRRLKRDYLFSFAGAPRPGRPDTVRNEILKQCRASIRRKKCRLLECTIGRSNCHKPVDLMKLFQSSTFCLQPPGDSYTRRSTFDSILAGCIPVFFHPGSAYVQYLWHLPKNFTKYSVFIPANEVKGGNTSIETTLMNISQQQIVAMREEVIKLIPKVIYADPRTRLETQEDAFDLTIKGVLERVEKFRSKVFEGKDPMFGEPDEQLTWKYNLFGTQGTHEWDHFFSSRLLK